MNHGLTFSSRYRRHAAVVAGFVAALSLAAETAEKVEKAKVSSKEGAESAIAPATAPERDEGLHLPGRSSSGITGIDIPPPSTSAGHTLDPKARKRLLQEMDRRRNWMFDDRSSAKTVDRAKGKAADGKKTDDNKPLEFESSRQRTLLEKRIAGDDAESRSEKADKEDRDAKDRKKSDPSRKDRDDQESDPDGDTRTGRDQRRQPGTETERDRDNRPFQQAIFSDPFTPARPDSEDSSKSTGLTSTGPKTAGPDSTTLRPATERNDGFLSRPSPGGSKSDYGVLGDFGSPRQTHVQQFNEILGGSDGSQARSGLLEAPKPAPKPFSQGPGAFGGAPSAPSFSLPGGAAFSTPAAPRPTSPLVKPQPGILPFPSRRF